MTIPNGDVGDAGVTAGDKVGTNGVIHVVDALLRPPAPAPAATEAPATEAPKKAKKGRR